MANKNKQIKSKANNIVVAWANMAKDAMFAGMTLTQFSQMVGDAEGQLNQIAALSVSYSGAAKQNDDLHQKLNATLQAVVSGVRADVAKYGPDSPLYKAMGYVPKSESASGLTRKAATTTATTQTASRPSAAAATDATSGGLAVIVPTTRTTTVPASGSTTPATGSATN